MLYDYCTNYIETSNGYYGEGTSKKIYSLCCDYILGATRDKQRQILVDFFGL